MWEIERPGVEGVETEVRQQGQGLAEYALILALVAIVAIVALLFLGSAISSIIDNAGHSL